MFVHILANTKYSSQHWTLLSWEFPLYYVFLLKAFEDLDPLRTGASCLRNSPSRRQERKLPHLHTAEEWRTVVLYLKYVALNHPQYQLLTERRENVWDSLSTGWHSPSTAGTHHALQPQRSLGGRSSKCAQQLSLASDGSWQNALLSYDLLAILSCA